MSSKKPSQMTYEQEVWTRAVRDAESDLLHTCPFLSGGRQQKETPEAYAERSIANIIYYRQRLDEAKRHLREVGG